MSLEMYEWMTSDTLVFLFLPKHTYTESGGNISYGSNLIRMYPLTDGLNIPQT